MEYLHDFLIAHYDKYAPHTSEKRREQMIAHDLLSVSWKQNPDFMLADYKKYQMLDGEGIRHSIYISYCPFNCTGCYNKSAQKRSYGTHIEDTESFIQQMCHDVDNPRVAGITLVGGEPFLSATHLIPIVQAIRDKHPDKTIWSYSGFLYEILSDAHDEKRQLLELVDVLIDGQYISEERDIKNTLPFRGSNNQRIIDVQKSSQTGSTIRYKI